MSLHDLSRPFVALVLLAGLSLVVYAVQRLFTRIGIGAVMGTQSVHTRFTPTGGGIVFVVALVIFAVGYAPVLDALWWRFLTGALVLGGISLADDIRPLPPVPRLMVQLIVLAITFKQLAYPQAVDVYLMAIILGVVLINTLNFLDGICGMLALYGMAVCGSLLYLAYLTPSGLQDVLLPMLWLTLLALIAFACFNLRDTIFAGDVGAITLGYIFTFALFVLAVTRRDASVIIFMSVCIFDTGLTTIQRLFNGENILRPHRTQLYQILTDVWRLPHVAVSLAYALLQLLINALYMLIPEEQHWTYVLLVSSGLAVMYFSIRHSPRSRPK